MSSVFPGAIDTLVNPTPTTRLASTTPGLDHAEQHANANNAIIAVQNTLGINPQGGQATVKARLDAIDDTIDALPTTLPYYSITGGTALYQSIYWDTDGNNFDLGIQGGLLSGSGLHVPCTVSYDSYSNLVALDWLGVKGEIVMVDGLLAYDPVGGSAAGGVQYLQNLMPTGVDGAGLYWDLDNAVWTCIQMGGDCRGDVVPRVRTPYGSFGNFEDVSYFGDRGEIILVDNLLYYSIADDTSFDEMIPLQVALSAASTGVAGVIELATDAEAVAGTDTARAVTPSGLLAAIKANDRTTVACSDETTAITTGTAKVTFRMVGARTLVGVRASLSTAQTSGSIFTVDVNKNGTTVLSTKLTVDNTEKTSTTAVTAAVISVSSFADDDEITIDVDQVGDGTAKGLKVTLLWG